jgi:3-hydroxyisobutyrate dehydrogenase-like beta-hydroxyacid dehydrogenase
MGRWRGFIIMARIGILGFGEIGSSVKKLYLQNGKHHEVFVKDLDVDEGISCVDFLHVCIPYSDQFVDQVCECIEKEKPKAVIINSTIPMGNTRKVIEQSGLESICHSPVRGVHPNLCEGLKTFEKYVGVSDVGTFSEMICEHFNELGIETRVVSPIENSELAKMASTTYYGLCIAWHGEMQQLCLDHDLDFEDVMTAWNRGYNDGYAKLGMKNVVRPTLYPPSGKIGGHCVIPNVKLMKEFFNSEALDLILKYG